MNREAVAALCRRLPSWLVRGLVHATQPHFVVSAAGIFRNPAGDVLLLRHVFRDRYPWGLPGGFLKPGETPEQGAVRELREETGLVATVQGIAGVNILAPRHVEVIVRGAGPVPAPDRLGFEIIEAGFFAADGLPGDLPPGHARHIRESAGGSC